jgi:hypothetical protein
VLGKNGEDFRTYKYQRRELLDLIGDVPVVYPSGRDAIGADILDSCPELQRPRPDATTDAQKKT